MIFTVLPIIAPVFIVAAFGYAWAKAGMRFDAETVSGLATYIGVPCLVFYSLAGINVELEELGKVALATAFALGGSLAVSAIVLRVMGLKRSHYLGALGFPNLGNMGLPICLFAFGKEGLALAMGYFMVGSISHMTLGIWFASGKLSPGDVLRNPVIYAIPVALLFRFGGFELPQWLANSTKLAGEMAMPMMLLALGASLAKISLQTAWRATGLSLLRFAIGISVGWAVSEAMGLTGALRGVVILQTSMPVAVLSYILALRYDNDPETLAGLVMQSTLLSMIVLPVLLIALLP